MFIRSKTDFKSVKLQHQLQTFARELRKNSTQAEIVLWEAVRDRKFNGFKFRRQHPLFYYIIDFYCHELKMIIEVDGPIHQHQIPQDQTRDDFFRQHGYIVIRFSNEDILNNLEDTLKQILINIPSPKKEEGQGDVL